MDFIASHLLSLILFSPLLAALVMVLLPREQENLIRWTAFLLSFVPFGLTLALWFGFDASQPGFQFEEKAIWYAAISSSYHLGVDGISLTMVLLTTLLTPLAILASFTITENVKAYMVLFFLLEMGMLGVFISLDLLLFFVFWEFGLVPMYFLINQWGSEKGEREIWGGRKVPARTYASFKFMIYTMAGSLGLLLAIQMIGVAAGTFDLPRLFEIWPTLNSLDAVSLGLSIGTVKAIAFWAFVDRLCHQGAGVALPHLAARRPHRSAHRRLDDPGGRAAQAGRLWLPAPGAAALSRRSQAVCRGAGLPGGDGDHLWRLRLLRADGFQAPGGVFIGQPHGLCGAGHRRGGLCHAAPRTPTSPSTGRCCRCSTTVFRRQACSSWSA